MFELVYSSYAPNNLKKEMIISLNKHSINYNRKHGISGCLAFYNRKFVGILEGEENKVRFLYQKIRKDPLHEKVSLLAKGFVWERQFKQWNMIYHLPENNELSIFKDNFYSNNVLNLALLADKKTYGTEIFWNSVKGLFS